MNTNPLPNYVTGSKTANALEIEGPMSLKMSLNKIYEMLVKTEYKEGSWENRLIIRSFCEYHQGKRPYDQLI